ncbi:hypothetical protein ACXYTJ_05585 [Gilvimarinus sp. F26214L]|uniref:hypothetical protein n=1 Tax=Gilvimarinus sp. DZF01 TaxID=3461371 RepID=UPI004046027B
MDQESIVYGCIKDVAYHYTEVERRRVNRDAMLSLPSGEEWPFLSQEMFSIPRLEGGAGRYQTQVMHFGASYKAVEYEWDQWIATFESLLRRMYWVSATVHLETELSGIHTFHWTSLSDSHTPGACDIQVQCEWSRENVIGM